jgi:hypothetical protein
MASWV